MLLNDHLLTCPNWICFLHSYNSRTLRFHSPLSSKLLTMFPSRISFWLFGVPSDTDTALNRSNINCGAFLWGATAGPRGKSFRWTIASSFSFAVSVASRVACCRPALPPSCGMASGLTHRSRRARRTSQRRRAPAVIFSESGLSSAPVGRRVIRRTRCLWWQAVPVFS